MSTTITTDAPEQATQISVDSNNTANASTTSDLPVQITNALSLAACLGVLLSYFVLRRKNRRIMNRTSLVLSVSMAISDLVLHAINLFGYSQLPHNFICAFFGGFMYALPTLLSTFYSVCIALNTQLVFVFSRPPNTSALKYYIALPLAVTLCICVPALGAGLYGYDSSWDLCWYDTSQKSPKQVLIPYLFTFGLWCLASIFYLIIAAVSIIFVVFSKSSRTNQLASNLSKSLSVAASFPEPPPLAYTRHGAATPREKGDENKRDSFLPEISSIGSHHNEPVPYTPTTPYAGVEATATHSVITSQPIRQNATLSRRSLAMRALAFRLIGYIMIPVICILPGVIKDLIVKVNPDASKYIPDAVSTMFDTINGLVGLFNAILYIVDPALLAFYHQIKTERKEEKSQAVMRQNNIIELELGKNSGMSPPPSPGYDYNSTSALSHHQTEAVEVRPGKYLTPIFIGDKWRSELRQNKKGNLIGGIIIRVDVQVDNDLEKLGDYLDGL